MLHNSDIVFVPGSCLTLNSARRVERNAQNESYVAQSEILFKAMNINISFVNVVRIYPMQHPSESVEIPPVSEEAVTGEHQQRDEATDTALRNIPSVAAIFVTC